jgi:hypothetical protein
LRLGLERGAIPFRRGGDIAGFEQRIAFGDQLLRARGTAGAGDPSDEFLDLALRQGADEAVDRLAVGEGDHRGDRLDAQLAGHRRMIVDVHLDQADLAA